ncbi:hypothetical protein CCZ01_08390 [Helicobacter monodelphidis]|uniref:antitoxin n=1 Tax=Helicobacter sp. 15-1451 TaxID=2004995 RepID=UPI000DCD4906|nr:type II toxin-antitoxin system VapB family antitoxin [Helicobacter sp. 15-1451]RAX56791.1 hypothetical protein CCZ01_08390 [Helicobacter sp. 15-1451]
MTKIAKLFQNGSSQAVRLPKEFRFDGISEVIAKKQGSSVILIPKDSFAWGDWFEGLSEFSADFATKLQSHTDSPQERDSVFSDKEGG